VPAELERSKLVDQLVEAAAKHVKSFGATEVTLALDGLARLRCQPSCFAGCSCAAGDCLMMSLEVVDGVAVEHGFQ